MLIFIQTDFLDPLFGITFLKGTFYKLFSISLDIAGFIAIVMLGGFFVRRFFIRPEGLETSIDDYVMHALLFSILITGFIVEGLRMAATELTQNLELARWSPVGLIIARLFAGMDQAFIMTLHVWLWWIHLLFVIAFLCLFHL